MLLAHGRAFFLEASSFFLGGGERPKGQPQSIFAGPLSGWIRGNQRGCFRIEAFGFGFQASPPQAQPIPVGQSCCRLCFEGFPFAKHGNSMSALLGAGRGPKTLPPPLPSPRPPVAPHPQQICKYLPSRDVLAGAAGARPGRAGRWTEHFLFTSLVSTLSSPWGGLRSIGVLFVVLVEKCMAIPGFPGVFFLICQGKKPSISPKATHLCPKPLFGFQVNVEVT